VEDDVALHLAGGAVVDKGVPDGSGRYVDAPPEEGEDAEHGEEQEGETLHTHRARGYI
jgi:hypothetical protein